MVAIICDHVHRSDYLFIETWCAIRPAHHEAFVMTERFLLRHMLANTTDPFTQIQKGARRQEADRRPYHDCVCERDLFVNIMLLLGAYLLIHPISVHDMWLPYS